MVRLAVFFCQNIPGSAREDILSLERRYPGTLWLFPLPCSGRVEYQHLLRALEEHADAAYLLTCPEGACAYFEGNRRAGKRVQRLREIVQGIGLDPERVGLLANSREAPRSLTGLVEEVVAATASLSPLPFRGPGSPGTTREP